MTITDTLTSRITSPHSNLRCELLERAHATFEPSWDAVAELLKKTFQGDVVTVVLHHGCGAIETLACAGLTKEWAHRHEESLIGLNPFLAEARKRRPAGGQAFVATADHLLPLPS